MRAIGSVDFAEQLLINRFLRRVNHTVNLGQLTN
jgi:hypothetical protein